MVKGKKRKPIPIYTTSGDWTALLVFPYVFSTTGEWIGFVTSDKNVFDTDGVYVGWITSEPRILRKRILEDELLRREPRLPFKNSSSGDCSSTSYDGRITFRDHRCL